METLILWATRAVVGRARDCIRAEEEPDRKWLIEEDQVRTLLGRARAPGAVAVSRPADTVVGRTLVPRDRFAEALGTDAPDDPFCDVFVVLCPLERTWPLFYHFLRSYHREHP